MNPQSHYVINSQIRENDLSSVTLRVTLYDRSLKPVFHDFLAREKLGIQQTTLDDGYIDYEIVCRWGLSVSQLDQMLRQAIEM